MGKSAGVAPVRCDKPYFTAVDFPPGGSTMLRHAFPRAVAALALFGLLVASANTLSAQPAAAEKKKVLTFADYDIWRTASGVTLSRDGQYVAYIVGAEGSDAEAVVRHIPSGKEHRF